MNYSEVEHPITLNAKDWNRMINELRFYKSRCELLQSVQHVMRDPERTLVCDVLANGQLYHNIENMGLSGLDSTLLLSLFPPSDLDAPAIPDGASIL